MGGREEGGGGMANKHSTAQDLTTNKTDHRGPMMVDMR